MKWAERGMEPEIMICSQQFIDGMNKMVAVTNTSASTEGSTVTIKDGQVFSTSYGMADPFIGMSESELTHWFETRMNRAERRSYAKILKREKFSFECIWKSGVINRLGMEKSIPIKLRRR